MFWVLGAIGLTFTVLPIWYQSVVLWRWLTWTRVDATVFDVNKKKDLVRVTYVVDGHTRDATKTGTNWTARVGDRARLRHHPQRPYRYQFTRPIGRPLLLVAGLAILLLSGVLLFSIATEGSRSDYEVHLPPAVAIILGLTALGIGSSIVLHQRSRRAWRPADGTITGVREIRQPATHSIPASVHHTFTYAFVDDVREATRTNWTNSRFRCREVGDPVSVRYDPANPDRNQLTPSRGATVRWWASAVTLIVLGAALVLLGVVNPGR